MLLADYYAIFELLLYLIFFVPMLAWIFELGFWIL